MNDIIKSGVLGLALIITLIVTAPILNEKNNDDSKIAKAENKEVTQDKDIHIPL